MNFISGLGGWTAGRQAVSGEPVEIPFGSHHRGTDVYTTTHCNKRVVNHSVQWGWAAVHSDVRTTSIQELLYYYYL